VVALARETNVPFELSRHVERTYRRVLVRFGSADGELLAAAMLEEQASIKLRHRTASAPPAPRRLFTWIALRSRGLVHQLGHGGLFPDPAIDPPPDAIEPAGAVLFGSCLGPRLIPPDHMQLSLQGQRPPD